MTPDPNLPGTLPAANAAVNVLVEQTEAAVDAWIDTQPTWVRALWHIACVIVGSVMTKLVLG